MDVLRKAVAFIEEHKLEVGLASFFIAVITAFSWVPAFRGSTITDGANAGQFGDFIGGYFGTVFLILSVVLLFGSYRDQRATNQRNLVEARFFEMLGYQSALMRDDIAEIASHKSQLNELGRHFDSLVGSREAETPSLELSCSFTGPELSLSQPLCAAVSWVQMRFGVCASLCKVINQPSGRASLRKLFELFDVEGSVVAAAVTQSLAERAQTP